MSRELERVLRDSDEGITKLRRRRSAEETQLAKARVADRRKVAAENGDDPKSAANFVSIRQLWFDYVDDWDLEIDPHEGPSYDVCVDFLWNVRSSRKNVCLAMEERQGRGFAVYLQALHGLPKKISYALHHVEVDGAR